METYLRFTNPRLILFSITFLIGVLVVYLIQRVIVPTWVDGVVEQETYHCSH
jgi:hypothetical protein